MAEKQTIEQLKTLRMIKPNSDWAVSAKERIIKPEIIEEKSRKGFGLAWLGEHGMLVASLVGVMVIFGIFFGGELIDLGNTPGVIVDGRGLADSLSNLESSMNIITVEMKNVQKAQEALAIREAVSSVIDKGEKLIAQAKSQAVAIKEDEPMTDVSGNDTVGAKQEVLSALSGAESALSAMKETSQTMQKEIAEREIAELKASILSEKQTKLLTEAEKALKAGDYGTALEKIMAISQLNLE